jgi:predicted dehydrogenase
MATESYTQHRETDRSEGCMMTDEQTVRVGVIGRGFGARVVAPTFSKTEGCQVVDVVSPRDDRAVTKLCSRDDVDLISVDSPPFMHLDHVRRAIDGGHAVVCQKPLGRNAAEAEEMCKLAADAGVLNLVTYEFRVHPVRTRVRALVLDGAVGAVEHVQWTSFSAIWGPGRRFGWSFDESLGGGWVRVHGSHNIDYIRWTFGEVVAASAVLRTTIKERPDAAGNMRRCTAEDGFTALLRTDRGTSAVFDATATGAVDRPAHVTVVGSQGVLEVLSENIHEIGGRILLHTAEGTSEVLNRPVWGDPTAHDDGAIVPWAPMVRDAVRHRASHPQLATFADGLACARVMDQLTPGR